MRILKNTIKIILAVAVTLGIIFGIYYFTVIYQPYTLKGIQKNPGAQLLRSFHTTLTAYKNSASFRLPGAIGQSLKSGSIDIQLDDENGNTLHNKLYLRNNGFAMLGSNIAADHSVTDTYSFWVTEDAIIGQTPLLLEDDTYYGINPKTMKEDIKDSALLDVLGMSYEEFCEMWDTALTNGEEDNNNSTQLNDAIYELLQVIQSCPVAVTAGLVSVSANEVIDVYRIVYTFTPDKMCEFLEVLQEMEPEKPVQDNAATVPLSLAEEAPQKNELEQLQEAIRQTNATAVIEFDLNTTSQMIVASRCRIDWLQENQAGTISANILLGAAPAQSLTHEARLQTNIPGEEKEEIILTYTKANAHNMPSRKLTVSNKGEIVTILDFQYNTVTNTFQAELMDREILLAGSCTSDEQGIFTIALDTDQQTALRIVFNPQEQTPGIPAYTNLCSLSEEKLTELLEKIEPEEPDWGYGEKYVEIAIYGADGSCSYMSFWHDYETLGELLIAEGCADLDASGRIENAYIFGDEVEGNIWTVWAQNNEMNRSVMEIPLSENELIEIYGSYGKNT